MTLRSDVETETESESGQTVTISLRRSHLWVAMALVVAMAAGFALGRATGRQPQAILYSPSGVPSGDAASRASGTAPRAPAIEDLADRPSRGPEDATVTMVEFVDFQCPFCGAYARETLSRIERTYGDRVRYISVQFPLASHPHAQEAARAAVCAEDAGVYWEFHELLFAHQDELDHEGLVARATQAGVPRASFVACLSSEDAQERVDADVELGFAHGVRSTPTFFVDGRPLVGALPYSQFSEALDTALGR